MESFHGAEVYELELVLFAKHSEKRVWWKNIGLYRDDGLICFAYKPGPELEKTKKNICKIFKDESLNIPIETNFDITEYLDVTFTLKTGKYYLYRNKIIIYYIFISNLNICHQ